MFERVLLLLSICVSVAWCELVFPMQESSIEQIVDVRLSCKVVYDREATLHFKEFCRHTVERIYRNPEGARLIDKISALLEETKAVNEVKIVDSSGGEATAFEHGANFDGYVVEIPDNVLSIKINLDNAIRVIFPKTYWYEQLFGVSECIHDYKSIDNVGLVYRISRAFSPFYVTIVHELIHLKHFLETLLCKGSDSSYIPCGKAIAIGTYEQVIAEPGLCNKLPELNEKDFYVKRLIPWDNFEERRTVVGPDIDGISELSFRIMEGLPIRYIYQGPDKCFYESPLVLHQIVKDALLYHILPEESVGEIITRSMIEGYFSEEGLDFTRDFIYSPLAIQLALFNDERIIRAHQINKAAAKVKARDFLQEQRHSTTMPPM